MGFDLSFVLLLQGQISEPQHLQPLLRYFLSVWLAHRGLLVLAATVLQSTWQCVELHRTHYLPRNKPLAQPVRCMFQAGGLCHSSVLRMNEMAFFFS